MRKRNIALWALTPVAVALVLSGCGSGSDNDLAVDNNAQNYSEVSSSGSAVVVGSGVAGDPAAPEAASGYRLGYKAKQSSNYMVVANTPLATKAGCDVLKAGGTAVDAAVAVQAVLGLVEPQSSTIAGSAFMMYYDAANKKVVAYDGRETAPAAATGYYLARQDQSNASSPAPRAQRAAQRPLHRGAGRDAHARHGPQGTRQAGLGAAV